ncbi:MAG: UDP-N-acetylglucosamine 1-carboxyvinyltransferase [Verrucomicrobia bacterium]|nr:UDP-N-acetylglucosamine 1-carboxyvinyltransferase [Verrucomicrobiota bacterium]MBU4290183.1 UDP-N-acetylglucosamine 1-carboxyvinyltransferase [Verrucomicrobiota bacterium]MBU4427778.1 UDP-N-acetylglucosamine 1-carboxyvinyltransferase [Verrucomicrobiota bacterium]MBU4497929.1 UDP-N-acetylglucosamine 1-carboxyvinyltransferase [Verrucomicrobiota bacterium]MCG2681695.1 UDP-N-acetylglucosamine 1-carboxyvinyltransferase [Kiritimatiellia bacterium]
MARFIIHGKQKLSGVFQPSGNKNSVLPMLAACLLTDEPMELANVPMIEDVSIMLDILEDIGVSVNRHDHAVKLCAAGIRKRRLDRELCHRVRSSILFAGPLMARHRQATLYPPGGDVIGRRRVDTHFLGLRALGVEISGGDHYTFQRGTLRGAEILLDEASVTATENILMAATLAEGSTLLFNAACEPHVQDLCVLLNKMGARITGIGTNRISVEGVDTLHGAVHTVTPDHVEIGSFLIAAAVTGGELTIPDVSQDLLAPILRPFRTLGLALHVGESGLQLVSRRKMRVQNEFGLAMPKIEDGPWPSFPSDLMSVAIVAGTQSQGTILFFEKMFESRMVFVDRLIDMGARIVPCDPHRVVVIGPSHLHALRMAGPDIRAGMAMLIAALCAKGESVVENVQVIDRGYERVEERLRRLGADIVREE